MEKFFDSINVAALVREATSLQFPGVALALGLQAHTAPRMLQARGAISEAIKTTGRSVLAGCPLSTSFCRAYLHGAIEISSMSTVGYELYQHVDDLVQKGVGESEG